MEIHDMAHAVAHSAPLEANPLDVVEQIVLANDWLFDRLSDDEIAAEVSGSGCVYHMWFAWRPEREMLHFSCAFDVKVPDNRRDAVYPLLSMINERMPMGHFNLWSDDGMVMFRQSILLRGGFGVSAELVHDLIERALEDCERYFPPFQFVIWGGKTPAEAIEAAILETEGEA